LEENLDEVLRIFELTLSKVGKVTTNEEAEFLLSFVCLNISCAAKR
jgi:hypothetical protein